MGSVMAARAVGAAAVTALGVAKALAVTEAGVAMAAAAAPPTVVVVVVASRASLAPSLPPLSA